jgi:hypothetical protein
MGCSINQSIDQSSTKVIKLVKSKTKICFSRFNYGMRPVTPKICAVFHIYRKIFIEIKMMPLESVAPKMSSWSPTLTWWKGLTELVGLFLVVQLEGVKVSAASNLELDIGLVLLYLHNCNTTHVHEVVQAIKRSSINQSIDRSL